MVSLSQTRVATAANAQAPVLRGRALEIVDEQGRVRSTLTRALKMSYQQVDELTRYSVVADATKLRDLVDDADAAETA